jgi:hypothetical protein
MTARDTKYFARVMFIMAFYRKSICRVDITTKVYPLGNAQTCSVMYIQSDPK